MWFFRSVGSRRSRRIRTYAAVLTAVIAAVMLVAAVVVGATERGRARRDATGQAAGQARLAAGAVADSLALAASTAASTAAVPQIAELFAGGECALALEGVGVFPAARLDLVRADGSVACSSAPGPVGGAPYAGAPWLAAARGPAPRPPTPPFPDPVAGWTAVAAVAPVAGRDGTGATVPVGVVAIVLGVDRLADGVTSVYGGTPGFGFAVTDGAGVLSPRFAPRPGAGFGRAPSGTWDGPDGTRRVFASAPVPGTTWGVYAGVPETDVLAGARRQARREVAIGALLVALVSVLGAVASRRITGPLRALARAVERAGRDPAAARVEVAGPAEVRRVAAEFNAMLASRAQAEAQLFHQTLHDPLTGLPNRTLLLDRIERALEQARAGGGDVAVLFVDIDRFKAVNESRGYEAGDRVLMTVADRLAEAAGPAATVARLGDDAFAVVCEGPTAGDVTAARRVLAQIQSPMDVDGRLRLAASMGLAVATGGERRAAALLGDAEAGMQQAKGRGGGMVETASPGLRRRHADQLGLEQDLRQAVEHGQLRVVYQPKVEVASGAVVGAEALVRWDHPERGTVPPAAFIPVAERTGQIQAIGQFVLEQACAQVGDWNRRGERLHVAVNVSAQQLQGGELCDLVAELLERHEVAPSQLCLELTETELVPVSAQHGRPLHGVRELGVPVSIDDFGTGYSSLAYLRHLPVDEVKIDRVFVDELGRDPRGDALVTAIITMASALDLRVVAEGVERREQLQALEREGCHLAQGYLFSRPEPPERFPTRVGAGRPA